MSRIWAGGFRGPSAMARNLPLASMLVNFGDEDPFGHFDKGTRVVLDGHFSALKMQVLVQSRLTASSSCKTSPKKFNRRPVTPTYRTEDIQFPASFSDAALAGHRLQEERQTPFRVFRSRERSHERRPLRFTSELGHAPHSFLEERRVGQNGGSGPTRHELVQVQSPLAAGAKLSAAGEASRHGERGSRDPGQRQMHGICTVCAVNHST